MGNRENVFLAKAVLFNKL